jgi:hypothetical protein
VSLLEKLPLLTDEEVVTLLANARRLAETGEDPQKTAALDILPALEAAAEERRAERLARTQAKRMAARRAPGQAAA